jgi:hypothetical protein
MVFHRFTKGPQIHFWISDQVVSEHEPPQTNSEAGNRPQALDRPAPDDRRKGDGTLPPYYHVEIF